MITPTNNSDIITTNDNNTTINLQLIKEELIQPNTTNKNNLSKSSTEYQKNYNILENIKILTHNIQGANDKLKMQIWLEFCYKNDYNIVSMTETKLAESTYSKFKLSNPYYDIYTSNSTSEVIKKQESSMGTLIAISKFL